MNKVIAVFLTIVFIFAFTCTFPIASTDGNSLEIFSFEGTGSVSGGSEINGNGHFNIIAKCDAKLFIKSSFGKTPVELTIKATVNEYTENTLFAIGSLTLKTLYGAKTFDLTIKSEIINTDSSESTCEIHLTDDSQTIIIQHSQALNIGDEVNKGIGTVTVGHIEDNVSNGGISNFTTSMTTDTDGKQEVYIALPHGIPGMSEKTTEIIFEMSDNAFSIFGDLQVTLGDINIDGDVQAIDIIMSKRSYLFLYDLTDRQFLRADIDKNGKITAFDYIACKRIYLGTYSAT